MGNLCSTSRQPIFWPLEPPSWAADTACHTVYSTQRPFSACASRQCRAAPKKGGAVFRLGESTIRKLGNCSCHEMSIMIGVCFLLHGKISQMIPIYSVNLLTVKVFLTLFPLAVVRAPQHTARRCTPTSSSYRLHEVSDCKSLATKQLRIISTSFQISGRNHASQ